MNELSNISQFSVGAVTIAANREAAIRAEILQVGDAVRVLSKPDYGESKVHTGVIVGFEPFNDLPTIIVAYIEVNYASAEMKMLFFNDKAKGFEILAAAPDSNIEIERSRVIDWFTTEERKKLNELDELRAKRAYFEKYFGSVLSTLPTN